MFGMGASELLIVTVVLVLVFNRRLPAVGESFGAAIRKFKKALHESDEIDVTPQDDTQADDFEKSSADPLRARKREE
jgi:TatA/E family protein of Tat protein translocase